MKKLLSLFTALAVSNSAGVAFVNNNTATKINIENNNDKIQNYIDKVSGKESLLKYKFETVYITDFDGLDQENLLDEVFYNVIESNPEYEDFIINVSENIENYKITGNKFVIPGENETNAYNLRITSFSSNPQYSGTAKIKVVFINRKTINIAQYQYLFSTKIEQLSLEAIGHANDPSYWQSEMLLELDKQLIENDADMHGYDGKDGHESLFVYAFENDLIEIKLGDPIIDDFSEIYKSVKIIAKTTESSDFIFNPNKKLSIKVDVAIKNKIDISSDLFSRFFKDPIAISINGGSESEEWKKIVFKAVDKRLEGLEGKLNKKDLFTKNIDHLIFSYDSQSSWDGKYEIYKIEIGTPSYIQDDLLANKTMVFNIQVNQSYTDITKEINYKFDNTIKAIWSSWDEKIEEKVFNIYKITDNFKSLHDFQQKYKTIEVKLEAEYSSNWKASEEAGKYDTFIIETEYLKEDSETQWTKIFNVYKTWGAMELKVYLAYKIYIEDNRIKVATKVWHKIKIDGAVEHYVTTKIDLSKVIISTK